MEKRCARSQVSSRIKCGPSPNPKVNIDHPEGRGHHRRSVSPRGLWSPSGPWTKGVESKLVNCDQASLSSGYETAGCDDLTNSDEKIDLQDDDKYAVASASSHASPIYPSDLSGYSVQVDLRNDCVYAQDYRAYHEPIYSNGRLRYDKEAMFSRSHDSGASAACAVTQGRRRASREAGEDHLSAATGVLHKPPLPGGSTSKLTSRTAPRWLCREDHNPREAHLSCSRPTQEVVCNGAAGFTTRGNSKQHSWSGASLVAGHEKHGSSPGHQRTNADSLSHLGVETNKKLSPEPVISPGGQLTQTSIKAASQFSGRIQAAHSSPAGDFTKRDIEFYLRSSSHSAISKDDFIKRWTNNIKRQEALPASPGVHKAYHMFDERDPGTPHASMRPNHTGYLSAGAAFNGPGNGYAAIDGNRLGGSASRHSSSHDINTYHVCDNVGYCNDIAIDFKIYPAIRSPGIRLGSPIINRINECLSDTTQNRLQGDCNRRNKKLRKKNHSRPHGGFQDIALWYTSSEEGSGSEHALPVRYHPAVPGGGASSPHLPGYRAVTRRDRCPGAEPRPQLQQPPLSCRSSSLPAIQPRSTDIYSEALEAELYSFEDYCPGPLAAGGEAHIHSAMEDSWSALNYSLIPDHCNLSVHDMSSTDDLLASAILCPEGTPVHTTPCRNLPGQVNTCGQDVDKENDDDAYVRLVPKSSVAGNGDSAQQTQTYTPKDAPWLASKEDSQRLHSSILTNDDSTIDHLLHESNSCSTPGSPWKVNSSPFSRNNRVGSFRNKKESSCSTPPRIAWDEETSEDQQKPEKLSNKQHSLDEVDGGSAKKARSMSMPSPILPRCNSQEYHQPSSPKNTPRTPKKGFSFIGLGQRLSEGTIDSQKRSLLKRWKRDVVDIKLLFHAVQQGKLKIVTDLLDAQKVDLCHVGSDGLSALDYALLLNHTDIAEILISRGARRNPEFVMEPSSLSVCLGNMGNEAKVKVVYLQQSLSMLSANAGGKESTQFKEYETLYMRWLERQLMIKQMRDNYSAADVPPPPTGVTVSAAGSMSLVVEFDEPAKMTVDVVTGHRIEWSMSAAFDSLQGEITSQDPGCQEYHLNGLVSGRPYYVRVMSCSIKGCGKPSQPEPAFATPSTWRDVDCIKPRACGKWEQLDGLLCDILRMKSISEETDINSNTPNNAFMKKNHRRLSLKNLFPNGPKFQKNLKQGLYLGTVVYCGSKVLVTGGNQLPVLEVSDSYLQTNISSHYQWFTKVACTWQDVPTLSQDLDKTDSSGVWPVREKLLQIISQMQAALGLHNLGHPYFCPIEDKEGSVVFVTVCHVEDRSRITNSTVKWVSLAKLQKGSAADSPLTALANLNQKTKEIIGYDQCVNLPLEKGLYLGYLHLQSSLDIIEVTTPAVSPSSLPHVKIRGNPNVSSEEWEGLKKLSSSDATEKWSRQQILFLQNVMESAKRLAEMHGHNFSDSMLHRLYDIEVVEFNHLVSMVILVPPRDQVCSLPGQKDDIETSFSLLHMPLQMFEIVNMQTYQPELMRPFCRASTLLEIDNCCAQQTQRQAITNEEMDSARENCNSITAMQRRLTEAWRSMRWLSDLISHARSKNSDITLQTVQDLLTKVESGSTGDSKVVTPVARKHKMRSSTSNVCITKGLLDTPVKKRNQLRREGSQESVRSTDSHETSSVTSIDSLERNIQQIIEETSVDNEEWSRTYRLYVAFPSNLPPATQYQMAVQQDTTAEDAIDFLIGQISRSPVNARMAPDSQDCYLVAVIGNRERILRERFLLRQLQKPWTSGRFYVRLRKDTMSALDMERVIAECV